MGNGTKDNPFNRADVDRILKNYVQQHGNTAGLDLSEKCFCEGIDLRRLDLSGVILKEAVFLASVQLGRAGLVGAHLEGALLHDAHLEGAHLKGAYLEGTGLVGAHLEGAILWAARLRGSGLVGAHLEGAHLENAHLDGPVLWGAHLEGAYLWNTQFSSDTKLESADWGNYILGEERDKRFDEATDNYRRLKQWHTNAGMYDIAAKFYYREIEAKRKAQKWKKKPHLKLWNWIMRLLCGYGEKPELVVVWAAVIIFGLATAYRLWGSFDTSSFWDTLYYSVVSFTAVGYGNWAPQPTSWAKAVGAAEAFIGVFMMALFLVTFTRKMTR